MLIVPASVLIVVISRELVYTFYGQRYDLAPFFLSLYIVTFMYSGFGSMVLAHLLNGVGETKAVLKTNILGAVSLIPSAPLLAMFMGVPGLITALLASSLSTLIYLLWIAAKKLNLRIDVKSSLKIYLASLQSAIPLYIFLRASPLSSPLNLVFGGVIYLSTLLTIYPLTKAITKDDVANLKTILSNIAILRPILKPVFSYEEALLTFRKNR